MKMMDCVEVIVEKKEYVVDGVHINLTKYGIQEFITKA